MSASSRRTARRSPFTRAIFIVSYAVVWWRIHAMTAASARWSTPMRLVRATVPLPTGVACAVTAAASARPSAPGSPAALRATPPPRPAA